MSAPAAAQTPAPSSAFFRRVLIVAILASFVAFLDGTVVQVALEAIERDLGGGLTLQQWVMDSYLIALAAFMLLAGSLSDNLGRVRILRWGLVGFAVTSLACALAPTGEILIAGRFLQGVAGALLVPSSLALIVGLLPQAQHGRAIGQWTAWTSTASLVGPLVGGLFADALSWRWVFALSIPPALLALWWARDLPVEGRRAVPVDWVGAALGAVGLAGVAFALIEQPVLGWTHPQVAVPGIVGGVALVVFLVWEARAPHPMLPLRLFRVRNFAVGNLATLGIYAALALGGFALTLFLQGPGHLSATAAGLASLPATIAMITLSGPIGRWAGKVGPRWFMATGPLVAAAGYAWMTLASEPLQFWWQIFPGTLLFGLGLAITVTPLTAAILAPIQARDAGIASAVNNDVARVAGLFGVAIVAVVSSGSLDVPGFRQAAWATAALLAFGGIVSAIGIQNPRAASAGQPTEL